MNNSNYYISLDVHDTASQALIAVKKGDNSRKICASLTENGKEYVIAEGCTAVFTAKKPDGKKLYNDCVIEDNTITYTTTNNTTSAVGLAECEFRLISPEDKLLICPRFTLVVEDTVVDDNDVMDSSDEFSELSKMVGRVGRADSVAQEALETAEEAVERASSVLGVYVGTGDMPDGYVIQIDPTGEAITARDWIRTEGQTLIDMMYPVGSIYLSVNAADPSTLFGGKWERLKDRFLLGAGDNYTAGATGGEAAHKLTADEMPSHDHQINPIIKTTTGNQMTTNGWMVIHQTDNLVPPDREFTTSKVYGGYSDKAGGSLSHNNMPPYLAVYMWKRIA